MLSKTSCWSVGPSDDALAGLGGVADCSSAGTADICTGSSSKPSNLREQQVPIARKNVAPEPHDDLELISKATGLLTIEIAFVLVFMFGGLSPANYSDITTGFVSFVGLAALTTFVILSALIGGLLSAAATLMAVSRRSGHADRLLRMSTGLLGLAGLAFGIHIFVLTLTVNSWSSAFLTGLVAFAIAVAFLLAAAWRLVGNRTPES